MLSSSTRSQETALLAALPSNGLMPAAEVYAWANARGANLLALMVSATSLRDQGKRSLVGYSRKVFIPLVRLCRNRCDYCSFSRPSRWESSFLDPDEVTRLALAGASQGCKEALFCLGERAEERYPLFRRSLERLGYRSTVDYLHAMCDLVWRESGLLPHFNCGVLEEDELIVLKEVSISAGLMLESRSDRLCRPGGPHYRSPGKEPSRRLATIAAAGKHSIAFTTGIIIGIGETLEERVDALLAIRELNERYGHIQEVIVQNFTPHPRSPMAKANAPDSLEMLRTIALARLILGPDMNLQAPPNLAPNIYQLYLFAGSNDWGGISPVTPDLINANAPWPQVEDLRALTARAGFTLRERLAIYPEFARRAGFVPPRFQPSLDRWLDCDGFVSEGAT